MDNYIKMCIGAKKIQEKLKDNFDFRCQKGYCPKHNCYLEDNRDMIECPVFEEKLDKIYDKDNDEEWDKEHDREDCADFWIGLLTVEQLFSLIRDKYVSDYDMLMNISDFVDKMAGHIRLRMCSLSIQELLLIFVMKRKYGKVWNNKDKKWIGEK